MLRFIVLCIASSIVSTQATASAVSGDQLSDLIAAYLRAEQSDRRGELAGQIEAAAGDSPERVASAIETLQIWEPIPASGEFPLRSGDSTKVRWRLPEGYNPTRRHPVLVCVPETGGRSALPFRSADEVMGKAVRDWVLVCVDDPIGGRFDQRPTGADDFRIAIREVRRRIHVDSDRLFLFGAGRGADAAWMLALNHADLFAGAILIDGYPAMPYPAETYAFWLGNLRAIPVLVVWRDLAVRGPARTRSDRVAVHNRAIAMLAERLGCPIVSVPITSAAVDAETVTLGPEAAAELLGNHRRTRKTVSQWFRFPAQGHAGWLRLVHLAGELWDEQQIDILPAAGADRAEFIRQVIQEKLAYLGGTASDNVMTISTRRAARIEVRLSPDLVDFARPVRVVCNGVPRFDGPVRPSVRTMLEGADETWDLQHPVWARLSFAIQSDALGETRPP